MERVKIIELKKIILSIIFSIGASGLLYSFPSRNHPMFMNIYGLSVLFICSVFIFLISLIFIIYFSRQKKCNKELRNKILAPKSLDWKKSFKLSMISLTLFASLFIFKNPTPGYAPHSFAYNIGFFIPILFISLGFCLASIVFSFKFNYQLKSEIGFVYKAIPLISLIPFLIILVRVIYIRVIN